MAHTSKVFPIVVQRCLLRFPRGLQRCPNVRQIHLDIEKASAATAAAGQFSQAVNLFYNVKNHAVLLYIETIDCLLTGCCNVNCASSCY